MSDSIYARENVTQFPVRQAVKRDARRQTQYDALIDQLQAAHAREKVWLREKSDLLQRHVTLSQEFEHRLANSLQMIVSVLSQQSRTASPEAAAQLTVVANRIASFARVRFSLRSPKKDPPSGEAPGGSFGCPFRAAGGRGDGDAPQIDFGVLSGRPERRSDRGHKSDDPKSHALPR